MATNRVTIEILNVRFDLSRHEPYAYIGRPMPGRAGSALGNYHPRELRTRQDHVAWFAATFEDRLAASPAMQQELAHLVSQAVQNGRVALACWCAPRSCHGETIARAMQMRLQEIGITATINIQGLNDASLDLFSQPESRLEH